MLEPRLRREADYESQALRERTRFFNLEHWLSNPALIRGSPRLLGVDQRSRPNALAIEVRQYEVDLHHMPGTFDRFLLLHLADLHFGMNDQFLGALIRCIEPLHYDLCVQPLVSASRTASSRNSCIKCLCCWRMEHLLDHKKRSPLFRSKSTRAADVIVTHLGGNQRHVAAVAHHAKNAIAGQRATQGHALICEAMSLQARNRLLRQSTELAQGEFKIMLPLWT
jgi:hypothetical protein